MITGIVAQGVMGSSGSTDPYWAQVVSLLHFDVPGTTFTDQRGKTWTRFGTDTIQSASVPMYGAGGLYVGNTTGGSVTNGIKAGSHADFNFGTADFTVEWWQLPNTLTTYQTAYDHGYLGTNGLLLQTGNGDGQYIIYAGGSPVASESSPMTVGVYEHHALVKDSGVLRKYRSGVQTCSVVSALDVNANPVGWGAYASNGNYAIDGAMDDCRITKGVCRYPGGTSFTPPAAAFPNS